MNAILNSTTADLRGAQLYVCLFPCNECAKLIIQVGIKRIIYLSDKYAETDSFKASRRMFTMAGVECEKLTPMNKSIQLDLAQYL